MSPEEFAESSEPADHPEPQPPESRETAIANLALLAFVATALGVVLPIYGAVQQMLTLAGSHPYWLIPAMVAGILFAATIPAFYFALYRGAGSLRFRDGLRLPALAAAILLTLIILANTGVWLSRLFSASDTTVLAPTPSPLTWNNALSLLIDLTNLAPVPLLYAFFRRLADPSPAPSPYRPLRIVATITVVAWSLWLAFLAIRIGFLPYIYPAIREQTLRTSQNVPTLLSLFADGFHQLIQQACLFAAPFLVWLSLRSKPAPPPDALPPEPAPDSTTQPES